MSASDWSGADEVATPALLRAAWGTYKQATRQALAAAGADDLPRNGPFVLGAIARTGAPLADIITALGLSKQAAGQLVDVLVLQGYLDRAGDPEDRRRVRVSLTERGEAVAGVIRSAVDRTDDALMAVIGSDGMAALRRGLAAAAALDAPVTDPPPGELGSEP